MIESTLAILSYKANEIKVIILLEGKDIIIIFATFNLGISI